MNDRFKFRVWDKRKNIYIKDFVFNFINKAPYITIEYFDNEYEYTHTFEEDEIIIEQCTGLKDKNGNLIYEGDIVDLDNSETYAVIQWGEEDGCWRIITCENTIYTFDNLYGYELTISGNIHENADLIKVGGK